LTGVWLRNTAQSRTLYDVAIGSRCRVAGGPNRFWFPGAGDQGPVGAVRRDAGTPSENGLGTRLSRVAQQPSIRPGAPAAGRVEDEITAGQQRRSRAPVRAVDHPGGSLDLVCSKFADLQLLVGESGQRRQQQPRRPASTAVTSVASNSSALI